MVLMGPFSSGYSVILFRDSVVAWPLEGGVSELSGIPRLVIFRVGSWLSCNSLHKATAPVGELSGILEQLLPLGGIRRLWDELQRAGHPLSSGMSSRGVPSSEWAHFPSQVLLWCCPRAQLCQTLHLHPHCAWALLSLPRSFPSDFLRENT